MKKIWRLAVIIALVAVACRAEVNLTMDIEEDGSGTFAAEIGFDEEFQQLLQLGGEDVDLDSLFSDFDLDIEGATTREEVRGEMTFFVAEVPFESPEQLRELVAQGGTEDPFETFEIEITDDQARIDARLTVPDATSDLAGSEDIPFDPDTLEDFFSFNVVISMPGEVVEHNADEVLADGSLRWGIPLLGGDVAVHAVSDFGSSGLPLWLIGVVVVGLAAIIGAVLVARRNRQAAVEAISAAGGTTTPMGFSTDDPAAADPFAPVTGHVDPDVDTDAGDEGIDALPEAGVGDMDAPPSTDGDDEPA